MSEIIETESVVLSKLAYGDSSIIADLFTEDYGRISVIVKGGRSPKSKIGLLVDPLNHLHVVFYKKDTRDIQLLSSAEILSHFPSLKDHLQKLKYAYGVIELIKNLMAEHEVNKRLFKGVLFDQDRSAYHPEILLRSNYSVSSNLDNFMNSLNLS